MAGDKQINSQTRLLGVKLNGRSSRKPVCAGEMGDNRRRCRWYGWVKPVAGKWLGEHEMAK
jgi:hypothetical protein